MEWRVGARSSFDLVQSWGRSFAGCWVGFDSICCAMIGRR